MISQSELPPGLLAMLACPRDRSELQLRGAKLFCRNGHIYPVVDGVPIFLLAEKEQTIGVAAASLQADIGEGPLYLGTIGLTDEERSRIARDFSEKSEIDAVISYLVGATSGSAYANMIGRMKQYPIPEIPLDAGSGRRLLDIGCNWGRWSFSAARKGWSVVGLDPSLGAIMASRRAFAAKGLDLSFVCGDARFLPFKQSVFDSVFSYSVLQHLSETDVSAALAEVGRVLRSGGSSKIQMAHRGGLRSTYHRTRPGYLQSGNFRVRYWPLENLRAAFEDKIGPTEIQAEAYGGLGLLAEDRDYVSARGKVLISASTALKKWSNIFRPLIHLADSVFVNSVKPLTRT